TDLRDIPASSAQVTTLAATPGTDTLAALRLAAHPWAPFAHQAALARRLDRILAQLPGLRALRIAILGDGTLDHFAQTLRFWLALEGFRAEVYLAPYGTFRQEILDPHSGLYAFRPDLVWLFATGRDAVFNVSPGSSATACRVAVDAVAAEWRALIRRLRADLSVAIIQNNFEAPSVRVFGHYDGTVLWSRANLIRQLNLALLEA